MLQLYNSRKYLMHVLTVLMNLKCQVPFLQYSEMETHSFLCKREVKSIQLLGVWPLQQLQKLLLLQVSFSFTVWCMPLCPTWSPILKTEGNAHALLEPDICELQSSNCKMFPLPSHTYTFSLLSLFAGGGGERQSLDLLFIFLARFKSAWVLVCLSNLPLLDFQDTNFLDDHYRFLKFLQAPDSTSVGCSPVRFGIPLYRLFPPPSFFLRKKFQFFFFYFDTKRFEIILY